MAALIAKSPWRPDRPLIVTEENLTDWATDRPLIRIHRSAGAHPWNALREFGPLTARWDPHPEPVGEHPGFGVMYTAGDIATAVAEVFQDRGTVDWFTGSPALTSWRPSRTLRLLDLTGDWLTRHGASTSLAQGPHAKCRAWARAIVEQHPELDGQLTSSTMTGGACVTLWTPSADAFPPYPDHSLPLHHPAAADVVRIAARRLGYRF
ncbi:hypothetical protein BKD30_11550 [Tersicoccus phoenicis]|uniref:RES domain-containing protein n=1 Tax=Tersicoccus phoenicis TaxID=554083 RepID=A0A1R1L7P5_9MICC|nr:RES family NAD+ phosphorylase [Tersicoccus phoenicis]OMH23552.1 hypothetical protein BKD30_11550 [Tersicoccus phoenicis]